MPNDAASKMKEFARRLLAYEAEADKSAGANGSAAFRVSDKLRLPLSRLAGVAGFRSLLSRALALAQDEAKWLKAVHVKADGALEGFDEAQAELPPNEVAKGELILIAQLLGLLVTFIGEALTWRLVQEAWPKVPFEDMNAKTEKRHE